jgi:hypothetical protein
MTRLDEAQIGDPRQLDHAAEVVVPARIATCAEE